MKPKSLLFLLLLLPAASFCQSINLPYVGSTDDHSTTISKIEVTAKNTIVTFKHTTFNKGAWVELNKSMYLQDADGEDRYNYVKSEGIPLRPLKHYAATNNEVIEFKVYFEKVKPETKNINIIERALSPHELMGGGSTYFNFYKVSLERSMPPPTKMITDTAYQVGSFDPPKGLHNDVMSSIGPMINNLYNGMLASQLRFYGDPANVAQMAKITKSYYDELMKVGFTEDQALKIITSKQLVSAEGK